MEWRGLALRHSHREKGAPMLGKCQASVKEPGIWRLAGKTSFDGKSVQVGQRVGS